METTNCVDEVKRFDKAAWLACLAEWKSSGLSASRFCREKRLSVHRFRYWQYRLAPSTKTPSKKVKRALSTTSFIPVTLKPDAAKMEIVVCSKWNIHVGAKIRLEMDPLDIDGLKRLIQSLAEV